MILVIGLWTFLRACSSGRRPSPSRTWRSAINSLVLQRSVARPRLSRWDRILWVWLSRVWTGWRSSLVIVQPATVLAWHRQDFLWFMSSDLFLTLPQLLPRHRRQVVLLVIRDLAFPHDEDDLQPLRAQAPGAPGDESGPAPAAGRSTPGPTHSRAARGTPPDRPRTATPCRRRSGSGRPAACRSASSRARCRPAPADAETTPTARGRPPGGPRAWAR